MAQMSFKRGATDIGRVSISRPDAQIFGQHQVWCPTPVASRKKCIHFVKTETSIRERSSGGLGLELEHRFIRGVTEIRLGHTHNCYAGRSHENASPTLTCPLSRLREMI